MASLFAHNYRWNPATRSNAVLVNSYIYNPGEKIIHFFDTNPEITATGIAVEGGPDTESEAVAFRDGGTVYAEDILDIASPRPLNDGSVTHVASPPLVPSGLNL